MSSYIPVEFCLVLGEFFLSPNSHWLILVFDLFKIVHLGGSVGENFGFEF